MMRFKNVDELMAFAVIKEDESNQFYRWMSAKASRPEMQEVFAAFALEELAHRAKLEAVRDGKLPLVLTPELRQLHIEDYLISPPSDPQIDYREALILAMKREKAAFKLYDELARAADDIQLKLTMRGLAQEEARHKLRFEIEFDDHIMTEM